MPDITSCRWSASKFTLAFDQKYGPPRQLCLPAADLRASAEANARTDGWDQNRIAELGRAETSTTSPAFSTNQNERTTHLNGLIRELSHYHPAEIELAWMLAQTAGHGEQFSNDTTGLAYLYGAALAGVVGRQLPLANQFIPVVDDPRQIAPIGKTLDAEI